MTKYNRHHPKSSIERISIPRKQGGRGIIDITCLHSKQVNSMRRYFHQNKNESLLLRAISKADRNHTPLNLAQEVETNTNTEINHYNINEKMGRWKSKSLHGRYPAELDHNYVDKEQSLKWLTDGRLFPETEGFYISIQDQIVATKNFRNDIVKDTTVENDLCRWCGTKSETPQHLMTGCSSLTQTEYTNRHDNIGKILHEGIENKVFGTKKSIGYWNYTPETIRETQEHALYWNRSILTDKHITHNRPDTIIWNKREKSVQLIDYAVISSHNITSTYAEKIRKYQELAMEIKEMWKVENVKIHPIIISTTGIVPKTTTKHIKELNLPVQLISTMQHSVILSICSLFRKTLNK